MRKGFDLCMTKTIVSDSFYVMISFVIAAKNSRNKQTTPLPATQESEENESTPTPPPTTVVSNKVSLFYSSFVLVNLMFHATT